MSSPVNITAGECYTIRELKEMLATFGPEDDGMLVRINGCDIKGVRNIESSSFGQYFNGKKVDLYWELIAPA